MWHDSVKETRQQKMFTFRKNISHEQNFTCNFVCFSLILVHVNQNKMTTNTPQYGSAGFYQASGLYTLFLQAALLQTTPD